MAGQSAFAGDDPLQALRLNRELTRRVRAQQRATWFPLLVLAAVTYAAIPVYRYSQRGTTCRSVTRIAGPTTHVCTVYPTAAFLYWPIALVLAYVAIAAFYVRRSRVLGLGTRVRPYVTGGVGIALVLTAVALWSAHDPPTGPNDLFGVNVVHGFDLQNRLASAACAIGLALLVLAWTEHSGALLGFAVIYLVIVLVPITFGWTIRRTSSWYSSTHLIIDGSVLLLGAIGFALAEQATLRRTAR